MIHAIAIIRAFSIKVASVIGNFKAVPKQAHCILLLVNKLLVTPTVVIPKTIIVRPVSYTHLTLPTILLV